MNKGKYAKGNSRKALLVLLALVLVIGCTVGGTLAWLTSTPQTVSNTFVVGEIGTLTLTETDADKKFVITPGVAITKDPKVTYTSTLDAEGNTGEEDVAVYVFVEVTNGKWEKTDDYGYILKNGGNQVMDWSVDSGSWIKLENHVYYKIVEKTGLTATSVILNDTINVDGTKVTNNNIAAIAADAPLSFTAYAIQKEGHDSVADAWAALNP